MRKQTFESSVVTDKSIRVMGPFRFQPAYLQQLKIGERKPIGFFFFPY
jgi:hypothetical protein